ncbi:MAG: hypothetical protein QXU69_09150 [Thermofilaceae archaeon]
MSYPYQFEEDGVVYVPDRMYLDYEDYVKNSTHHTVPKVDLLPRGVAAAAARVYRRAMGILVERLGVPEAAVDRFDLFDIGLRTLRTLRRIKSYARSRDIDSCAEVAAYIYMYARGVKMELVGRGVRSLALKVLTTEFDGEAMRRRFVASAIERIANGDFLLYKILAASVAWLGRRISTSPSLIVACACRIAALVHPSLYRYRDLVARFRSGRSGNAYADYVVERLGVRVEERSPCGDPLRVALPADLCREMESIGIEIPGHATCR